MFDLHTSLLIDLFQVLAAAFALWKGSPAERIAAGVVVADVLIGRGALMFAPSATDLIHLVTDGLAALALLFVTVRYAAFWMGGVMLFFAAQFALHSYYLVMEQPHDYVHALINNINWSAIAWCLIIGTAVAWRARIRKDRAAAWAEPTAG
jgi:hypothetical protein